MFKAKRAIILAAGFGSRMKSLTQHTPKPLIPVHGTPMIETTINCLNENGIEDIIVIVGHLKEQFDYLTTKYSNVRLVENPYYNTCNNISSIYSVRDFLDVPIIIVEGDQFFTDGSHLDLSFEHSEYNVFWTEELCSEWFIESSDNHVFEKCNPDGGANGWILYGVSRWTKEDANTLRECITYEFENGTRDCYWDDIPVFLHKDKFDLYIRPMSKENHVELDSLEELAAYDPVYLPFLEEQTHENE